MSNKNLETTELRQDTSEKQTNALKNRIKFFQEQKSTQVPRKLLDIVAKGILGAVRVGDALRKLLPEESQKKVMKLYQKLLLSF